MTGSAAGSNDYGNVGSTTGYAGAGNAVMMLLQLLIHKSPELKQIRSGVIH
jgi:hypothetical protein